jgi:signal peptide peptidase SppA
MSGNTARDAHVLAFALGHPWALQPDMLPVVAGILARHLAGTPPERAEVEAALVNRKAIPPPRAGTAAIIPVYGVIAPRVNLLSDMSGGTTFEALTAQLREAVASKDVQTIVLDVDSPGGSVAGSAEFAAEVMRARATKPVIAVAQYTMGSAAYCLASAATQIVAAPSARVGSIGVYAIHNDLSEALKQMGVKRTFVSAGEGKVAGNPAEPLDDAARARMQATVDEAYAAFVGTVVKGRGHGVTADRVRRDWQAHVYGAPEALALGMIDDVATLDQTLARIAAGDPVAPLAASLPDTTQEPARALVAASATVQDRGAASSERQRQEVAALTL